MHLKLNDEDLNYLLNLSKEILEQYNIKLMGNMDNLSNIFL